MVVIVVIIVRYAGTLPDAHTSGVHSSTERFVVMAFYLSMR